MVSDLLSEYGIDLWEPSWRSRPWPWLYTAIAGLLAADTRIARLLAPRQEQPEMPAVPAIPRR